MSPSLSLRILALSLSWGPCRPVPLSGPPQPPGLCLSPSWVPVSLTCPHFSGSLPNGSRLITFLHLGHACLSTSSLTWGPLPCVSSPSRLPLTRRSPEGKGAEGDSAPSSRPGTGPGDGWPSRCPDRGSRWRGVPAGTLGAGGWPESFCAAAVGTHFAFRRRGIRGPGRLPAGAWAPAQPAAPRGPVARTLSSAHARALPGARLLRLLFPPLVAGARPRAGYPGRRRRPPRRCGEGAGLAGRGWASRRFWKSAR